MKEPVELDLSVSSTFFSDLESKLLASADRFVAKLQTSSRAVSASGAGAPATGSQGPGGSALSQILGLGGGKGVAAGGGAMGALGGFLMEGAKQSVAAMGSEIRNLPMGQLESMAGLNKVARSGLGGFMEGTVGKVPLAGDWIMAQYHKMNDAIDAPEREAVARLGSYYANLDAAGIHVDEAQKRQAFRSAIKIGRVRWESMRESERIAGEVNMTLRPLSFGASQLGR